MNYSKGYNTSVLTALANDFGYDEVSSRQVNALAAAALSKKQPTSA